jgi:hypothetical protein
MTETENSVTGIGRVNRLALCVWGAMLVLTGTCLRNRLVDATGGDWLVFVRVAVFAVGLLIGARMLLTVSRDGPQAVLRFYIVTLLISAVFCPAQKTALAYWLLTAGGIALTVRLTALSSDKRQLESMERMWVIIMLIIVVKDSAISLLAQGDAHDVELRRLGRDVTSPALLGLYAVLAFWLLPVVRGFERGAGLFMVRALLLGVVLATRTRIVMLALLGSALILYAMRRARTTARAFWLVVALGVACELAASCMGNDVLLWFNRGLEVEHLRSLTGRTEVWSAAMQMVSGSFKMMAVGCGHGMTRYYLNWQDSSPAFFASHCHSAWIEHLFSAGVLGLIGFTAVAWSGSGWVRRYPELHARHGARADRAAAVMTAILIVTLTEIPLGGRINPAALLFLFYVATLPGESASVPHTDLDMAPAKIST